MEYVPPTPIQKSAVKRKIFTSDARKEIQSPASIERESEKDSEIDKGEKDDSSIEQTADRDSEALVRDSDESDSSHETTPQKVKKARKTHSTRYNFRKYYKGPKRYMPGTGYNYKFENVEDEKARKYLLSKLKKKKETIRKELDKLFRGKSYDFSGRRKKFPCIVEKKCEFLGNKLGRHLKSKVHDTTTEDQGKFPESFVIHLVNFITLVVKSGTRKPTLYDVCKMFFERMKSHIQHQHQLVSDTPQFNRMLQKNINRTEEFVEQIYKSYKSAEDDDDTEQVQEPAPKKVKVQKYSEIEEASSFSKGKPKEKEQWRKKAEKHPEKRAKEITIGKSSSKEIRLRGKFSKVTYSRHLKEKVFKHKLPVTKEIQRKYQLQDNEFRYYYSTSENLLEDYKNYIKRYCQKKDKMSDQYVLDVSDIWNKIDPNMLLHPNELKDEENLESKFFLPQKQLLLDNKDKPPEQQEPHMEASTIRSKLISLNRFLRTLSERSIFIGLNTVEVDRLKGMISQCNVNLKDLLR